MFIRYNTKNYEPSEKLQGVISKKLAKLDRFFIDEPNATVVLRTVKRTSIMEITLNCQALNIRCERYGDNFYDLIDDCLNILEKLIIKNKSKINKRIKLTEFSDDVADEEGSVVRIKSVAIKPMDVNEAILELDLLGHDFYMFENSVTGKMNTVYKRKDGNYGLIEPVE